MFHIKNGGPWTAKLASTAAITSLSDSDRIDGSINGTEKSLSQPESRRPLLGTSEAAVAPLATAWVHDVQHLTLSFDGPYGRLAPFHLHRTVVLFAGENRCERQSRRPGLDVYPKPDAA
jgi:hypothetical protein